MTAEKNLHKMHAIIYLALDYLTYVEYGKKLQADTYYYEKPIFKKIIKASQSSDRFQRSRNAARIIADNFEEYKFQPDTILKLGAQMIYYKIGNEKDGKEKAKDDDPLAYRIADLKYFQAWDYNKRFKNEELLKYVLKYLKGEIGFDEFGEAHLVFYLSAFRKYKHMTASRLELGARVLKEALSLQKI